MLLNIPPDRCNIHDRQYVSAANIEIEITRLDETPRIGKRFRHHLRGLDCFGICVYGQQGGELACRVWPENIRIECDSTANRNGNITLDCDSILAR
jgi:hypothetical protein